MPRLPAKRWKAGQSIYAHGPGEPGEFMPLPGRWNYIRCLRARSKWAWW
jgi:hypothetical protein